MSPTISMCPVSTNHGSGPRVRSVPTSATCSGVCPGRCRTSSCTLPSSRHSPSRTPRNEKRAPALESEDVVRAGHHGERRPGRVMVGVHVRVDHVADAEPDIFGGLQVVLGIVDGVDDRAQSLTTAAEEIRRADDRISVQELAQNHDWCLTLRGRSARSDTRGRASLVGPHPSAGPGSRTCGAARPPPQSTRSTGHDSRR
jgi:hypothetical protein